LSTLKDTTFDRPGSLINQYRVETRSGELGAVHLVVHNTATPQPMTTNRQPLKASASRQGLSTSRQRMGGHLREATKATRALQRVKRHKSVQIPARNFVVQ